MKIYDIHYKNEEDYNCHEYFTNKTKAQKRQNKLKVIEKHSVYDDDYNGVNMLYDISEFDVEISKNGILDMLNNRFNQTQ
jgi:hypothetical protein